MVNSKGLDRSTHGLARHAAIELRAVRLAAASLLLFLAVCATAIRAQTVGRLIDVIDVSDRGQRVEIVLQFNCSLRLLGYTPQREGTELRLRLRPDRDCGFSPAAPIPFELAPLSGAGGIITAARLDSVIAGEAALSITFARSETFLVAQGTDARGLRIRLVRSSARAGTIVVQEPTDTIANFAINLESQREPFDPQALELAAKRLKTPAFVSTVEVDGEKYYRLRVGPIDRRSVAERVLRAAARDYPRAWLAIGDDNRTSDPMAAGEVGLPAVEPLGADSALEAAARKTLLSQARKAMRDRNYPQAIALLTRLQRQPQFPERPEVQELLGLSRERSGQLAHAKAEYEEYLRRYPEAAAAPRVRQRLRILRAASLDGRQGTGLDEDELGWRISGGASQLYRRDSTETDIADNTTLNTVSQNAVYNDVDLLARRGGDRFDLNARVSGGYAKDLLSDGPGDRSRVSTAYFELNDRGLGASGRFGRQSRGADGVLGTFDGLSLSYGLRPSWTVSTSAGLPAESSADGVSTDRRFLALALGYAPEYSPWEASVFLARQQYDGLQDRQAVGIETRYFAPNRSLSALIDYDVGFSSLNAAVLFGTLLLPARWTLSFDLERRNAPVLTARNALIGQAAGSIDDLRALFTDDQILDLAQDRTPVLSTYSVSTSKPLGTRFQMAADVIGVEIGDTPASGGVAAQPGTGLDLIYQVQVFGNSLLRNGDFNVLAFRYNSGSTVRLASASLMSRFPVFGSWRLSPRLRVDERTFTLTTGSQRAYVPSLRVDYLRNRTLFELEVGAELGELEQGLQTNDSTRFFVGLGYRLGF